MAALNKVQIIGNLGRDPEFKSLPSGQTVCNFTVAVTERYKNREGVQQETTEWFNVQFWGKQAEICNQYLKKGMPLYVEGKLRTRSWDDESGKKQYRTEVIGDNFQMLGRREGGEGGGFSGGSNYNSGNSQGSGFGGGNSYGNSNRAAAPAASSDPFQSSGPEDDLPF
jgi:single-strand DNA-binding protein